MPLGAIYDGMGEKILRLPLIPRREGTHHLASHRHTFGLSPALTGPDASSELEQERRRRRPSLRQSTLRAGDLPGATALHDAIFGPEAVQRGCFFVLGAIRFPPATEVHLLALLYSRAKAHKL